MSVIVFALYIFNTPNYPNKRPGLFFTAYGTVHYKDINVFDVGPTLYTCYTNVFVFIGIVAGADLAFHRRVRVFLLQSNA